MNWIEEPEIPHNDDTPSVIEQARSQGWQADIIHFGKAEQPGIDFFNPGLVRRPDGLWLLVRTSAARDGMPFGHNQIWACKFDGKQPLGGPILKFPNSRADEQFEDPRAVYWNGQTWISCVNFEWFANGSWTGAHQMLGVFKDKSPQGVTEESWSPLARRDPIVGTNQGKPGHTHGKHNKNLTYFFLRDTLYCVYTSDPWHVVQFGDTWEKQIPYISEGVSWNYGIVRGGTPPVLVGDKFYTFFHSSVTWTGRYRRYYMGALAFEANPPFKPLLWTQKPILIGSQNDPWQQRKPLVVFPCGAVFEDSKWLISLGINDLKCAWVEIPHADVEKMLSPVPIVPALSLLSEQTKIPEHQAVAYQPGDENLEERGDDECQPLTTAKGDAAPTSEPAAAAEKSEEVVNADAPSPIFPDIGQPAKRGRGRPRGSVKKKT